MLCTNPGPAAAVNRRMLKPFLTTLLAGALSAAMASVERPAAGKSVDANELVDGASVRSLRDAGPRRLAVTEHQLKQPFENSVRDEFRFLLDRGFAEVATGQTKVVFPEVLYRKGAVEVSVSMDPRSYEIDVCFSINGRRCHYLGEVQDAVGTPAGERYRVQSVGTPERIAAGVAMLGALVRQYGAPALDGDPQFYSLLEQRRAERAAAMMKEHEARRKR
jgi:hypothetical protein